MTSLEGGYCLVPVPEGGKPSFTCFEGNGVGETIFYSWVDRSGDEPAWYLLGRVKDEGAARIEFFEHVTHPFEDQTAPVGWLESALRAASREKAMKASQPRADRALARGWSGRVPRSAAVHVLARLALGIPRNGLARSRVQLRPGDPALVGGSLWAGRAEVSRDYLSLDI
jgi:hypothetical protein